MLSISLAVVPQSAWASLVVPIFSTATTPPSMDTFTSRRSVSVSVPFGPLAVSTLAESVSSAPFGICTGFLPILLIVFASLPDFAHVLASQALAVSLAASHDSLGSRKDRDTVSVLHLLYLMSLHIDAAAFGAHAGDFLDSRQALGRGNLVVFQGKDEILLHAFSLDAGIETRVWPAAWAFRILVSMSAIGSSIRMCHL